MRELRPLLTSLCIASFSLAGCASAPADSGTATEPAAAVEKTDPKAVAAEVEKKPEPLAEKPATVAASSASERPATPVASRDDNANSTARLIAQLNDATREIAALRASNAKLKAMAAAPAAPAAPAATAAPARERAADPADEKLAASFKSYTQFKQDLASVFADLERLRADNAALGARLKDAAAGTQEAKATLAKLEGDLKAEKAARAQAEQTAAKLRDQLRAVAAAVVAAGLSLDKVPAESGASARLETSETRVRGAGPAAPAGRKHVVKEGETLERIADRYYGDPTRWRAIFEANRSRLPLDGGLPAGLELEIPAK